MRKTFLYVCAVAMLAVILPSCLGDNESTYQGTREFGVINIADNGVKYAAVGSGLGGTYITWDGISSYAKNDAVLLTYKINTNNIISGTNILKAEYATVAEGESFPYSDQKAITSQAVDTTKQTNSAFFKTFNLNKYSSNNFFSDRWLFSYTAGLKDGEVLTAKFYYDATKQVQKNKTALPENAAIVDVILTKTGTAVGTTTKTEDKMIVADMTSLRRALQPSSLDANVTKSIWFRIMKEDSKVEAGYTLTYIQNAGYLLYSKSE
ncbi:hypothetical protein G7051_03785 [Dysgonomonas sp. HDW5B]|uniref:hypothetical protein n=1 Tax=Dysgonomonas sp. HDW5B TaxID=2714927 RepID=UPI00140C7710|nr:hypothetical protein [Dysgonomonas sp. HDW5B]QIK53514.1 hypothetical protein G7051_03785 [Dysgonomonas sp. HDW5B]